MLHIVFSDALLITAHVGSPLPEYEPHMVETLQADGHELEKIVELFTTPFKSASTPEVCTIPLPNRRVVCWYGDMAKTIASALQGWREW